MTRTLLFLFFLLVATAQSDSGWYIGVVNSAVSDDGPQLVKATPTDGLPWAVEPMLSPCLLAGLSDDARCRRSAGDSVLLLRRPPGAFLLSAGCAAWQGSCAQQLSAVYRVDTAAGRASVLYAAAAEPWSPLRQLYRPYGMTAASDDAFLVANMMSDALLNCSVDGSGCVLPSQAGCAARLNGPNCMHYAGGGVYVTTEGSVPVCSAPLTCTPSFPDGVPSALLYLNTAADQCPSLVAVADAGGSMAGIGEFGGLLYVSDFLLNLVYVVEPGAGIVDRLPIDTGALPCAGACYTGELLVLTAERDTVMLVVTVGSLLGPGGALVAFRWSVVSQQWGTGKPITAWTDVFRRPMGLAVFPNGTL